MYSFTKIRAPDGTKRFCCLAGIPYPTALQRKTLTNIDSDLKPQMPPKKNSILERAKYQWHNRTLQTALFVLLTLVSRGGPPPTATKRKASLPFQGEGRYSLP